MTILTPDGKPAQGPQKPDLWANDVRRLLPADPCPCGSQKPDGGANTFEECHLGPPRNGYTPENTLHLLFTAIIIPADGCEGCGSPPTRIVVEHGNNGARIYEGQVFCKVCGLCRCEKCLPLPKAWAVQTAKMSGEVWPETIVQNFRGRLASPPVQNSVQKLQFHNGAPVVPKVIVIDSLTELTG